MDALIVGDASPTTLQESLGMASNLLAHHVGVLERAGLVRRIRSEGDRRRSYLSLVPHTLDDLRLVDSAAHEMVVPRVVFVCTENAARSQLAAALWSATSDVPSSSAGTHPAREVHPGALAAADRRGLDLIPQSPRSFDEVRQRGDVVITVCDRAHEELTAEVEHNHWSVPDPVAPDTPEAFDRAVSELSDRISRLAPGVRRSSADRSGPPRRGSARSA